MAARGAGGFVNSELAAPTIGTLTLDPLTLSTTPEIATERISTLSILPSVGTLFKAHHVTQESNLIIQVQPTIIIL
ncbi:MAG TPA: hypothetical protein VH370_15310 [Humisphaera sp.]|nr:hypothetical protein [Humisphaera sp.]